MQGEQVPDARYDPTLQDVQEVVVPAEHFKHASLQRAQVVPAK